MMRKVLNHSFYSGSPLRVAPKLLGKILVRSRRGVRTSGRIVEVEAYLGSEDPASHAYRGPTPRNQVMFGPPGFVYVYFTYGNHYCVNVVTGRKGKASAVLIRALEPLEGTSVMRRRRKKQEVTDLTSGPGKLTQAMAIDRKLNGADLMGEQIWIEEDSSYRRGAVARSPRIGISVAQELNYRFYISASPYVSKRRLSPLVARDQRLLDAARKGNDLRGQ